MSIRCSRIAFQAARRVYGRMSGTGVRLSLRDPAMTAQDEHTAVNSACPERKEALWRDIAKVSPMKWQAKVPSRGQEGRIQ